MCTAITFHTKEHYFGRNLDLEHSYGEQVVITPRNVPLEIRRVGKLARHYAMIGVACVSGGYPLYYEATNEKGLSMAGLNFPHSAHYREYQPGMDNIAPFELIPWVLGRCGNLAQARACLERVNVLREGFSPELPLTALHWMVADGEGALTLEPGERGLEIFENKIGVLTNEPPFPWQMTNLNNYLNLTSRQPENRFSTLAELSAFSRGMGGIGLPGDLSSASRFVRASFVKLNGVCGHSEEESVSQFFHTLNAVEQQRGCVRLEGGQYEITRYSSCCNTCRGIYYYTTYDNPNPTAVELRREDLEGTELISYPMLTNMRVCRQN